MTRISIVALGAILLSLNAAPGLAQEHQHTPGMTHAPAAASASAPTLPREGGQAAFAAMGEISSMLQADPNTDWSKVDMDGLRGHLVDMDNVFMRARVVTTPVPGGARFEVSSDDGAVRRSIQHMAASHAAMADGEAGRHEVSTSTTQGATLTVTGSDESAQAEIRALGFFGLLTGGVHHQLHHLMMAKGEMHH